MVELCCGIRCVHQTIFTLSSTVFYGVIFPVAADEKHPLPSQSSFISTMNFNLRVVDKIEDVKDNEHFFQVIDQKRLGKGKDSQKRTRGQTQLFGLDIQIGTVAANEMLSGKDNRTAAHELGHTGGLKDKTEKADIHNLMIQKGTIQDFNGNYMQATDLSLTQIRAIRDNYIHKRLHKPSVLRNNINKKR